MNLRKYKLKRAKQIIRTKKDKIGMTEEEARKIIQFNKILNFKK